MTGSPDVTENPPLGIVSVSENALAVIFWQPVQWQAEASSGGAVTAMRVLPQRQPPAQGSFQSCMLRSDRGLPHANSWTSPRFKCAAAYYAYGTDSGTQAIMSETNSGALVRLAGLFLQRWRMAAPARALGGGDGYGVRHIWRGHSVSTRCFET